MGAKRASMRISGLVQGVFYRQSACAEACRLALTGWVANRPDGDVDVVVEGSEEAMNDFIAWCRRGPPAARVASVTVAEVAPTGEFSRFEVRR